MTFEQIQRLRNRGFVPALLPGFVIDPTDQGFACYFYFEIPDLGFRGREMNTKSLWVAIGLPVCSIAFGQNLLTNGDFEAASILGSGQTEVPSPGLKLTAELPTMADYAQGISGIQNWDYALDTNVGPFETTDIGIASGIDYGDGDTSRKLFINRWSRRVVQSPQGVVIEANTIYRLSARSYMQLGSPTDSKRGVLSLFAGIVTSGASLAYDPSATLLGVSRMVTADFGNADPNNHIVGHNGFHDHEIEVTIGSSSPFVGQPLTVSMFTADFSDGRTYWDNVSLTATPVPEPSSMVAVALGLSALAARRRSKK